MENLENLLEEYRIIDEEIKEIEKREGFQNSKEARDFLDKYRKIQEIFKKIDNINKRPI